MLKRFKEILKIEKISGKDFCEMMRGLSYGSYRVATSKKARNTPKWVLSFIIGYELGKMGK